MPTSARILAAVTVHATVHFAAEVLGRIRLSSRMLRRNG